MGQLFGETDLRKQLVGDDHMTFHDSTFFLRQSSLADHKHLKFFLLKPRLFAAILFRIGFLTDSADLLPQIVRAKSGCIGTKNGVPGLF